MQHILFFLLLISATQVSAQETLEEIRVTKETNGTFSEYWEENKGTQIFSGKKNTVTDLKQIPKLQTNNYRQATSQTPGLLISEIPNESLAAMTYRGLGDPHESYNILLLQDGLPVAADMYGYPAHYYSPALPMMEKFQFIRGGAGLLYGPQPGGVVNYLSAPLYQGQAQRGQVGLTAGSYNLLSTNNAVFGSSGDHAYGVEYFRRQGNGPQSVNSDFTADYVQLRNHTFKGKNKYKLSFNGYNSDHGEPGAFAKTSGANANVYGADLKRATKRHDRLKVTRAQLAAGIERRIDKDSELHVNLWGQAYERFSKRQRGGGFGTFPSGADAATNTINTQRYYGLAGEVRYRRNYRALGNEHSFSGGVLTYNIDSPLVEERGARADANSGVTRRRMERKTRTNSFFAENRFAFGKLMVTPGIRVESIRQTIDERKNAGTGTTRADDRTDNQPLFGLGLAYHTSDDSQLYANASESYKPITYQESVPLDASTEVSEDIAPSKVVTYELGHRGQTAALNWDLSAFFIRYENKFGQVGTASGVEFRNTGAGTHQGIDAATELKLANFVDTLKPFGNFNLYANISILDARYTRGSLKDKTPMYAPKTISRVGLIHSREERYKVALMGVILGQHFGTDDNADERAIGAYTVFDLTADVNLTKAWLVSAGINNLFDREYYSRVRNDGLVWALDRNFYAGVTYQF